MNTINEKTTEDALKNSKFPFWVHKGWFNRISKILNNKRIVGKNFVSLTDGMPIVPGHGDSVIIFNRQKLVDKGYKFLKIEYTKQFFNKHPEVLSYMIGHKSVNEIKKFLEDQFNANIEKCKKLLEIEPINKKYNKEIFDKIKNFEKIKTDALKDPLGYFLEMIKFEDEIITNAPLEFDIEDIEKILISSRTFERYSPMPLEFEDKVIYLEDYFPSRYSVPSPISEWLKDRLLSEILIRSAEFLKLEIVILYQLVFALILHPEWEMESNITLNFKSLQILPKKLDSVFRRIDFLDNDDICEITDYIFSVYILNFTGNTEFENLILERLNKKLKI